MLETLGDIIIVKPLDEDYFVSGQRKGSHIFIPDWIRNNHERGVVRGNVVVAGPKCVNVKVGDVVIVNKPWAHWENLAEYGGVRCAILHEVELLAKIEYDKRYMMYDIKVDHYVEMDGEEKELFEREMLKEGADEEGIKYGLLDRRRKIDN